MNNISSYRNIGIMAHIDAGKTTITERILYYTGILYKIGEVHEGNATMDWMPQERERGITITSAATTCFWNKKNIKYQINIIDTPGHVDFTIEVERSLRVLDGAVVIFDSVSAVESQSETVWRQADKHNVPRICFVNKMDKIGANLFFCKKMIQTIFDINVLLMQLPVYLDSKFLGIFDLLLNNILFWKKSNIDIIYKTLKVPNLLLEYILHQKNLFIDLVLDSDDLLMYRYFKTNFLLVNEIKSTIRFSVLSNNTIPLLCGSAFKNKGIQPLLDAITDFLPSPSDVKFTPNNFSELKKFDLCALAFKIMNDSFVGLLTFVRIYSGKLITGSIIYNTRKKKKERVSRILIMHANNKKDIKSCYSGDIVALTGLKNTFTGDTLSELNSDIILEKISYPNPVMVVAIEPKTKKDQEKMLLSISKLIAEDPSLNVIIDSETNQTKLGGMGELHLEIILDRIRREFDVDAKIGAPQVSYRETIEGSFLIDYLHKKQSGGAGQFARVKILFEKNTLNGGYIFESRVVGGNIPKEYIPTIKKAIMSVSKEGVLCGFPVVDFKAILIDGDYHDVDSSALAFEIAAKNAFRKGIPNASPILMEPLMHVEILTSEDYIGDIIGHLNSIRGKVLSMENKLNTRVIKANVPLSNMFGYVNTLRSMTQGRAQYNMTFSTFCRVPNNVLDKIIKNKI